MKTWMTFCYFLIWATAAQWTYAAGGGSSGVGAVEISPGILAMVANHAAIAHSGNDLIDLSTGEKILHIDPIDGSSLAGFGSNLVPSVLGGLHGYEFLPNFVDLSRQSNFWIICQDRGKCVKLTPLSARNPRILDIIGGLQGVRSGGTPAR